MPRVQLYENRVNPSGPSEARLQPGDFSANIGPGLQAVSHGIEDMAQTNVVKVQQARELARTQYTADLIDLQGQLHGSLLNLRDNAADGATGHLDQVRTTVNDATQPFLAGIKDPVLRNEMRVRVAGLSNTLMTGEAEWADQQRQRSLASNAERAVDTAANSIMSNPTPENLAQTRETLNTMISGWSGAPESLRIEHRQRAFQATAAAYVAGIGRDNPGAALATLRSGAFDSDLSPEQRRSLETTMDTAQRQRISAARSQAQAQIDVFQGRLRNHDPTITDAELAQMGQLATAVGIPTEAFNLATARVMHQVDHDFQHSTPIEIRNAIGALNTRIGQAGEHASPDDVVKRDHLQTLLNQRETEMQHDPGSIVERRGVAIPPLDGSAASIQARVTAMRTVQNQTGALQFYRPQEADVLRSQMATGPNGRLSVINQVAAVAAVDPQMALAAAEQVAPGDRTFRHALRVNPAVRALVVRGADARRTLPGETVLPDGTRSSVDAATQAWFLAHAAPALAASQPDFVNDTLETARNIYAALRLQSGATGAEPFSEVNFAGAVNLALGRSGQGGGIGRWGNSTILLPTNMSQPHFDALMHSFPTGDQRWPPGSINGVPVYPNGQTVSREALRTNFTPVAITDGVYQFRNGNQIVMTREGRPLQIDVRRLEPQHPIVARGAGVVVNPRPDNGHSRDPTMSREQYRALYGHD